MEIKNWNSTFTEENHVLKNPKVLLKYLKEHQKEGFKQPQLEVNIKNVLNGKDCNEIVVFPSGEWLREDEYKLWKKAFKDIHINDDSEIRMTYIQGLVSTVAGETTRTEYYEGTMMFSADNHNSICW